MNVIKEKTLSSSIRSTKIIHSDYLKKIHCLHSQIVNWLAFLGTMLAFGLLTLGYVPDVLVLSLFALMWLLTEVGVTVGFHRHFTHRSFKASRWLRILLGIAGSMAAQGTLISWTTLHRCHHENSDQPKDPHSPYFRDEKPIKFWKGLWHSFMGWTTHHNVPNPYHYSPDLLQDQSIKRVNHWYLLWVLLGLVVPMFICGLWMQNLESVLMAFLWVGLVRIFITKVLLLSITSLTHIFGFQSYVSKDRSTNNIWLVFLTLGESWHNTHHAFPNAAVVGFKWWQFDLSGWIILFFNKIGWAWDLKMPSPRLLEAKKIIR